MSSTIKLKQGDSGTELDLNVGLSSGDATVGWNVEDWLVQEAEYVEGEKSPLVTETMDLLLKGSDHDDLATRKQSMHQMQVYASRFIKDRNFRTPVWLHAQTCGESNERRALVHSIKLSPRSLSLDTKGWIDQNIERYRATIVREPYWESLTPITQIQDLSVGTLGGEFDFSSGGNTVVGDVPARLYKLRLKNTADAIAVDTLWLGFRSDDRHTDLDNFPPAWDMEDASWTYTDVSTEDDLDCIGDKRQTCDFSSETDWYARVRFDLDDVSSNLENLYGKYLVLLRARASDIYTVSWVQLKQFTRLDEDTRISGRIVEIPALAGPVDTPYHFYPLGVFTIPMRNLQGISTSLLSDSFEQEERFALYAKQVSGSGDLYMDCLMFVPIDEYFIHVENSGLQAAAINAATYIAQCPRGIHHSIAADDTNSKISEFPKISTSGIGVPVGNTRLYVVGDDDSDPDDELNLRIQYYNRWLSLRGAE